MSPNKTNKSDETRLLIRAIEENADDHWGKVVALSKLSPVKLTFRFNGGSFHGVRVSQMSAALVEDCEVDADGCPISLRKATEYFKTNRTFIVAASKFSGARLDVTVKINGNGFLGANLTET